MDREPSKPRRRRRRVFVFGGNGLRGFPAAGRGRRRGGGCVAQQVRATRREAVAESYAVARAMDRGQ